MYRSFETYNFLRLLLPFIAGVIGYLWLNVQLPFAKAVLLINFIILLGIALVRKLRNSNIAPIIFGVGLNLLLIVAGNYLSAAYDLSNKDNFFSNYQNESDYVKLQIDEPFVKKGKYYKSTASIIASFKSDTVNIVCGKTYINIKDADTATPPQYGDILIVQNKLFEIDGPKNIGDFDYQRYSNLKQIHYQAYLKSSDYVVVCSSCGSKLWAVIYQLRVQLIEALAKNINDETTLAISSALLLGQKNFLTKAVKNTFADTGAMHILAVSGLHVGILFLILNFLFKPFAHGKWGRVTTAVLSVLIIWIYAGLTGFSASVTRASLMFSLFLIGDIINKDKNTYNILAASAFIILLYRPNMLAEVGFQLSYAAVFSIVTLYPYIFKWFTFKSKFANFFWSISAVSIAAQIGTAPISLYYFNQFPTTFLLANLIAIPAATIIFISGISILVFSFIAPFIATFVGKFLEIVISSLHFSLSTMSKIPYSKMEFHSFSNHFPFLMFLFFVGLITWLLHQKQKALWVAAFSLLLLCCSKTLKNWEHFNEERLLVYNNNNGLVAEVLTTGKSIGKIVKNTGADNFSFSQTAHKYFGINDRHNFDYPNFKNLYSIKNQTVFVLNDEIDLKQIPQEINIDLLIIENNPYIKDIENFARRFENTIIIISSNNSNISYYKTKLEQYNVNYYSIKDEGMYVANL